MVICAEARSLPRCIWEAFWKIIWEEAFGKIAWEDLLGIAWEEAFGKTIWEDRWEDLLGRLLGNSGINAASDINCTPVHS